MNLNEMSFREIIEEVWRRVMYRSAVLGIELPPIENEVLRLLNEGESALARGYPTPDWLSEYVEICIFHARKYLKPSVN